MASSSYLETLLGDWKKLLSDWAVSGRLTAAATEALQLKSEPELLQRLVGQWSKGDFSGLPPIVLLPSSSMPRAAGAYAISTGTIYLNQDWLQTASRDWVLAVLTEELGHHLDGLLNVVDTPGDEGRDIAKRLLSASSGSIKMYESLSYSLADTVLVFLGKQAIIAEASRIVVPVEDDWSADSSTTGVLRPGTATGGEFYPYQDKDWFRMDLEKGVNYVIEGSMGYPKVPFMAILTVGPTGETRVIKTNIFGTPQYPSLNSTIPFSPETTGTYYLSVSGGGSGEDYWLNMRIVAQDWSSKDVMPPMVNAMSVSGSTLTMTLNEALKTTVPEASRFRVLVGGLARSVSRASVNASGKTVTLQLASPVSAGQAVSLAYTDKSTGNDTAGVIEDAAGNDLESFNTTNVANISTPPLLPAKNTLVSFSSGAAKGINRISEGQRLDFEVTGAKPREMLYISIRGDINEQDLERGASSDSGNQKLNGEIRADDNGRATFSRFISLDSYTDGDEKLTVSIFNNRLYNASGLIAENSLIISDTSKTRLGATIKHESRYMHDGSIRIAEGAQIKIPEGSFVNTDVEVKGLKDGTIVYWRFNSWDNSGFTSADISEGPPQGESTLSGGSRFKLGYQISADTTIEPDEKFYIKIYEDSALSKEINVYDMAPIITILDQSSDSTGPSIEKLSVNGSALTLTLNEALKATVPEVGRFRVLVGGAVRAVSNASVNGDSKTVTLQLGSAVSAGQAVTLAYTDRSTANDSVGVIEDVAGNDLASFTARSVSNVTVAPDRSNDDSTLSSSATARLTGFGPLSLSLTGTSPIDASGDRRDNIINGNTSNNRIYGDFGKDVLTGGGVDDSDTFVYSALRESMLGSYDIITDFSIRDKIDAPSSVLNNEPYRLTGPQRNISALNPEYLAATFDSNSRVFYPGSVVSFTVSGMAGTFVAMNDSRRGFQADTDAVIHLKNYTISSANYVDFI